MNHLRNILNLLGLSLLYIVFTMVAAHIIDAIFYNPNEDIKHTNKIKLFIELTLQTLCCVIAIYYIRKIINFIVGRHKDTDLTQIYNGEIIISIIFIATQDNLLKKINHLVANHHLFIFGKKSVDK